MLEALDNVNRSQNYLIGLGFKIVNDEYEVFRQFIVEDNCFEYDNFHKYLADKKKLVVKHCETLL